MSSADGGEEQAAAGEAGARRAEAAADDAEGRDAAGGRGRAGAEDSGPHEGRNGARGLSAPRAHTFPQMPSSLEFFFSLMCKCARWCHVMTFFNMSLSSPSAT